MIAPFQINSFKPCFMLSGVLKTEIGALPGFPGSHCRLSRAQWTCEGVFCSTCPCSVRTRAGSLQEEIKVQCHVYMPNYLLHTHLKDYMYKTSFLKFQTLTLTHILNIFG